MIEDPQLRFWLAYAAREGALVEPTLEGALVLLPEPLQTRLGLPEEVRVTADPEVAEEGGWLLLAPGHPALERAAEQLLEECDVSYAVPGWPSAPDPRGEALLAEAREELSIDHGKIELAGPPASVRLPACRVGVLVTYHADRPVQEREEIWLDATTALPLGTAVRRSIEPLLGDGVPRSMEPCLAPDLGRAFAAAERVFEEHGVARLAELARESHGAREEERRRIETYYEAVLASIAERRERAAVDRRSLYEGQAAAAADERGRRLRELEEAERVTVDRRPFRLHLALLPAMRLPVDVCRGPVRHPFQLVWLHATRRFLPVRCPRCGEVARLVAGRRELGCVRCLTPAPVLPAPAPVATAPESSPAPVEAPAQPVTSVVPGQEARASTEPEVVQPSLPFAESEPPGDSVPPAGRSSARAGAARRPLRVDNAGEGERERELRAYHDLQGAVIRLGRSVAFDFWRRVADRRQWRRVAAESPLAALYRLYGAAGPLFVIGAEPRERLQGAESWTPPYPDPDGTTTTWGTVETDTASRPFALRWRVEAQHAVLFEVLPATEDEERWCLWPALASPQARAALWQPPPPSGRLDGVAQLLWEIDLPQFGLPLVVRCLASWWRPSTTERVAGAELPLEAVAAALVALTLQHVAGRPNRAALAESHGVSLVTLTKAVQLLRGG